jgi:predicted O-methyltransferase YrrM
MAESFGGRLCRAWRHRVERLRNWREDRFPGVVSVPRVAPAEFFRQHGLKESPWNALRSEFEDDTGLPTLADREFLFAMVASLKPRLFLELGTWRGGTSAAIKMLSPATEVITINYPDPLFATNPLDKDQIGIAFRRRGLDVRLIWADSAQLPELGLPDFDLILVDADHHEEPAFRDMENSWRKLVPGGWMLLHDFVQEDIRPRTPEQRWVYRAFRRFAARHGGEFGETFQFAGSWIGAIQKRVADS